MDEKTVSFNENQLKRTGFGEAFTPDLIAQMERGISEIQHKVQKEYEGDKVEATLHLKKSTISDYYILKNLIYNCRRMVLPIPLSKRFISLKTILVETKLDLNIENTIINLR